MNINTLVEMIIAFAETHDWRATFERCIPLRKLDVEDETGNGFDYHNIRSAGALEAISEYNINRYQLKHALHILCEKRGLKYAVRGARGGHAVLAVPRDGDGGGEGAGRGAGEEPAVGSGEGRVARSSCFRRHYGFLCLLNV